MFFRYWFPVLVWVALIFYLSGIPRLGTGLEYDFLLRKCAHVAEYAVLSFLFARALLASFQGMVSILLTINLVVVILYASLDEFHQSFVPGRVSDWKDVLADTIGGFLGGGIYPYRRRISHKENI